MPHTLQLANVINAPADKIWAEMRDFIQQTKHMKLSSTSSHGSPGIDGTTVGCIRHMSIPGVKEPVVETLTKHSDEHRSFSLTVATHQFVPMVDYVGTVSVAPLGSAAAQSLVTYNGHFQRIAEESQITPEVQLQMIEQTYTNLFNAVKATVESGSPDTKKTLTGRLGGKVCLITGGASGLGAAMATAFTKEGATVVIADLDKKLGDKLQKKLSGSSFVVLDVTKPDSVEDVVRTIAAKHGRLDVVVNNAGIIGQWVATAEHPTSNWEQVRSVNLDGAFFVLRAALRQMKSQEPQGGVVLNMVSTSAFSGFPAIPAYTAAKAGLMGLTRSTAAEYGVHGIRVLALAPTGVVTPMVMKNMSDIQAVVELRDPDRHVNPIPGMPSAKDVAGVAVFACSDEAKWVTGCVIPVDGGYLAGNTGYGPDMNRGARL